MKNVEILTDELFYRDAETSIKKKSNAVSVSYIVTPPKFLQIQTEKMVSTGTQAQTEYDEYYDEEEKQAN